MMPDGWARADCTGPEAGCAAADWLDNTAWTGSAEVTAGDEDGMGAEVPAASVGTVESAGSTGSCGCDPVCPAEGLD
jgi:hypothetical protein